MLVPAEDIREEADILERTRRVTALRHVNIPTAAWCGYLDKPGSSDLGASYGTRRAEVPAEGR